MNGYLVVNNDNKTATATTYARMNIKLEADYGGSVESLIQQAAREREAGVYQMKMKRCSMGRRPSVSFSDTKLTANDVQKVIATLQGKSYAAATTATPGIAGYQEGAMLATASLEARARRNEEQAEALIEALGNI